MQKLSVAAFLMLVLIQTALSAPAENNRNQLSTRKVADPLEAYKELTEKLKALVEHELKQAKDKFEGLVGNVTSPENEKKIKDLMAQLANDDPVEAYKKLVEELTKIGQHELAGAKAKLDEFIKEINSSETHKKVKELLNELTDGKLAEKYQKLSEKLKNIAERELAAVKAKYEDLKANLNKPEASQKLKDFMAELSGEKIAEMYKRLSERMANEVKHDLASLKTKIDNVVKSVNSPETEKKLKEILGGFSQEKLEETYKKVADSMTKFVEHEVAAIKAKVEELIGQIKPGNGKN